MASKAKAGTKWGSFFEKAVAGVESRLDTILGEDDVSSKQEKQTSALDSQLEKPDSALNSDSMQIPGNFHASFGLRD